MNKQKAHVATLSLFAAMPLSLAHAEQPSSITLSCNGTAKYTTTTAVEPEVINNLGIIVNLADRTVTVTDYVTPIANITATQITFRGQQRLSGPKITIDGSIDRVTGKTSIDWYQENIADNTSWELTCRPATRLF
jgi:hypothetical protein